MVTRANSRRYWPIAVTVSVLLHGTALLALALLADRQAGISETSPPPQLISFTVAEIDSGDASFVEPSEPPAGMAISNRQAKKSGQDNVEPVVATLNNPLESGLADGPGKHGPESENTNQSPGGVEADTAPSFFRVGAPGRRIVFVLDGSASMGMNNALRIACAALKESVRKLPAGTKFQIIIYNDHAPVLLTRFPKWLEATPEIILEVEDQLDRQIAQGSTEHEGALRKAFYLEPDVVYFLTDADDLEPRHVRLVNQLNTRRAAVHTIELNTRNRLRREMPLQLIARQNQGTYQAVDLDHPLISTTPTVPKMKINKPSAP
jgi:von Willebrand factor type A domain